MSIQIQKDEGTAALRRVPMRLFTSDGTSPDTGASGDSVILGIRSATTFIPDALVTAINSAQGMYYVELSASNVSILGNHPLYHTQGSFSQHVANVAVVNNNPFSTQSNLDLSTLTVFGVSNVSSAAQIADQFLARDIQGGADSGRSVSEALFVLRNRVLIDGSVGTVYQVNDSTSAFTFSITTATAFGITDINPA
jgi:hypothetical protein